ncbi:MAG: hypothetical protein M1812_004964 [Candelaria pacifica]|nr:MAG: hypothetical protein M1812_004964 [Candelaria pacifica]
MDGRLYYQSSSSTSAYVRHLQHVDAYVRHYGGEKPTLGSVRTERDILEANHRFIRDEGQNDSHIDRDQEKDLARRYYDSLFREFALIDLSRWREKQVAMRWRTKSEVLSGKGHFACASLHCSKGMDGVVGVTPEDEEEELRTFELNFGYTEEGVQKNALVKSKEERQH